jgi:hypothetical protein
MPQKNLEKIFHKNITKGKYGQILTDLTDFDGQKNNLN